MPKLFSTITFFYYYLLLQRNKQKKNCELYEHFQEQIKIKDHVIEFKRTDSKAAIKVYWILKQSLKYIAEKAI